METLRQGPEVMGMETYTVALFVGMGVRASSVLVSEVWMGKSRA